MYMYVNLALIELKDTLIISKHVLLKQTSLLCLSFYLIFCIEPVSACNLFPDILHDDNVV